MALDQEAALKAHIDYIVRDYALENIAIDHVEYTRRAVSENLSRNLQTIPTIDKSHITLPEDPLVTLFKRWRLAEIKPYDQKWSIDTQPANYLRTLFTPVTKETKSERIWSEETFGDCTAPYLLETTILTKQAVKETPRLGHGYYWKRKIPLEFSHLARGTKTKWHAVSTPLPIEEETLNKDSILKLKPVLDSETKSGIMELLKENPLMTPAPPGGFIPSALYKLVNDDSPVPKDECRPMSPPIFSRDRRRVCSEKVNVPHITRDISRILSKLPLAPIEEEEPMHISNGRVIDGWNVLAEAYPQSSSRESTPDLIPASSSYSDDLRHFMPSSPNNTPLRNVSEYGLIEKMDEVLFPRVPLRKDGKQSRMARIDNFSDIIGPIIPHPLDHVADSITASRASSPHSVGDQEKPNPQVGHDLESESLTSLLGNLCEKHLGSTSHNFVLEERIEERDSWLMDLPALPTPPFHHSKRPIYNSLKELLKQPAGDRLGPLSQHREKAGLLKKVSGVQPLNLELSWRPFVYGSRIPTHAEMSDVIESPISSEMKLGISAYLRQFQKEGLVEPEMELWEYFENLALDSWRQQLPVKETLVLNRAERNHLARKALGYNIPLPIRKEKRSNTVEPFYDSLSKRPKLDWDHTSEPSGPDPNVQRLSSQDCDILLLTPPDFTMKDLCIVADYDVLGDHASNDFEMLPMPASPVKTAPPDFLQRESPPKIHRRDPDPASLDNSAEPPGMDTTATDLMPPLRSERFVVPTDLPSDIELHLERLSSVHDGLASFLKLRGIRVSEPIPPPVQEDVPLATNLPEPEPFVPVSMQPIPEDLLRCGELHFLNKQSSDTADIPACIVSFSLMQKIALTKQLQSRGLELVERASLDKPDLILDPFSCVAFYSLASLPASVDKVTDEVSRLSWCYSDIVLIFESYSEWRSFKIDAEDRVRDMMEPYPFPLPVIKAVKKLRRMIGMGEGTGTKNPQCRVGFMFARGIEEAAQLTRLVCEAAKAVHEVEWAIARSANEWLGAEEWEGEEDLASMPTMNLYAAVRVLSQTDLVTFLEASSKDRLEAFGSLIGTERMMYLNSVIEQRLAQFRSPSPT